jgi:hypothetical protein
MSRTLLAALLFIAGTALQAQVSPIDAGVFTLYVNGQTVGTEQFQIHRRPQASGFEILATSTITMGERRTMTSLTADTAGIPIVYRMEGRDGDKVAATLQGNFSGRRLSVHSQNESGTSDRELPIAAGTVVLDEDVVHHYYFLFRQGVSGRVPVVVPRRLTRDTVTIVARGEGLVELGNGSVPSRRLTVTNAAGVATDVWIDAAGRVLRVQVPSRGLTAIRDDRPR